MKTYNQYFCTDRQGYTERYDRVGNWQKVKYSFSGRPFVTYRNKRYYLDTFYRIGSAWCSGEPFDIQDHAGRKATLHGYEMEEYYKPLFLQLSDDCECARLFRYEGVQHI